MYVDNDKLLLDYISDVGSIAFQDLALRFPSATSMSIPDFAGALSGLVKKGTVRVTIDPSGIYQMAEMANKEFSREPMGDPMMARKFLERCFNVEPRIGDAILGIARGPFQGYRPHLKA